MPTVVFVLLDGFRHDYLSPESTPILHRLASARNALVSRTREPFGFQSRPAFLAGLHPEESGVCMLFKYSPETSPFKGIGPLARFIDVPKLNHRIRRRIELRTARLPGDIFKYLHTTAQVPLSLLSFFDYSEKDLPWNARFETPTIFDLVRDRGGSFLYMGWPIFSSPEQDGTVVRELLASLKTPHSFVFVQLVLPDAVGHKHGPDSDRLVGALERTDARFGHVLDSLRENLDDFVLLVFGDHGMVKVENHLDLWGRLKAGGPKPGRDYLLFLDSTTARFWFPDESSRAELTDMLRSIEGGRILDSESMEKHHVRFKDRSYGDLIFLVEPGNLIHPSFFGRKTAPKGMHGYDPDFSTNQGLFIIVHPEPQGAALPEVVDHVDLYATAVKQLGFDIPPAAHGRDLLGD